MRRAPITAAAGAAFSLAVAVGAAINDPPAAPPPQPGSARCLECHQFAPSRSHPLGVRPRTPIPAEFPLESGAITCTTCHLPGHDSDGPRAKRATLRIAAKGSDFCSACHTAGQRDQAAAHALALGRAHLDSEETPASLERNQGTDQCLQCHDGSAAMDTSTHTTGFRPGFGRGEHPVGIPYPTSGRPGRSTDERLAIKAALDKRVQLPGGMVACTSCHSLYSQQRALLVMSNQRSRLCLACHVE